MTRTEPQTDASPLRVLVWLPPVLYTLLIWWLSSQEVTTTLIQEVPLQDKGVHFMEYGALAVFLAHAFHATWPAHRYRYLASAWLSVLLGLTDELHQVYVPSRSGDVNDLIADSLGITVATLAYAGLRWLLARRAANRAAQLSRP